MRFEPITGWWLLIPFLAVGIGIAGWHMYQLRKAKKRRAEAKKRQGTWIRRSIILILSGLLVLGPSVPGGVTSPGVTNLDVLFAVDTTASMGAIDYDGQKMRIDGVKQDMLAIADKLKGAQFGIVTFDSSAEVLLPFTTDSTMFDGAVRIIKQEVYSTSNGSAIDKGIESIEKLLKNRKALNPDRSQLIFYMGDGEQTIKEEVKTFKDIAPYVEGGAVLGYGSTEGAKIERYSGLSVNTKETYIQTPDSVTKKLVPAISKLDEQNLKKIAGEIGVAYQHQQNKSQIEELIETSNAELITERSKRIIHYQNIYWLVATPFALLLLWEWKGLVEQLISIRRTAKKEHHGRR